MLSEVSRINCARTGGSTGAALYKEHMEDAEATVFAYKCCHPCAPGSPVVFQFVRGREAYAKLYRHETLKGKRFKKQTKNHNP